MSLRDIKKNFLKSEARQREYKEYDLKNAISKMLLWARAAKGLTQDQLASAMGTSQSAVARAENGHNLPTLSFLQKMADAYETTLMPPKFGFMVDYDVVAVEKERNSLVEEVRGDKIINHMFLSFTSESSNRTVSSNQIKEKVNEECSSEINVVFAV